jgi:Tfp pilus assembly protein PilO
MLTLKRRERVVVGIALVGLLAVALYLYVVEPLVNRSHDLAELTPAREATLEARRRLIAQRPRLTEELVETAKTFEQQSARLLPGPTAPLAASDLQKVVKDAAEAAKVDVRSERVLPPTDLEGLVEVPIELTVAGGIRDTVALLYQLERTSRLLTVKDVKMRVVAIGQPHDLVMTLTVAGYLLPPAAGDGT